MLLTKTVKIRWNSFIKKYYTDKQYIFTKMNDEFEVDIKDLQKGSHSEVDVICDCLDCLNSKPIRMTYKDYNKYIRDDGKYYCNRCATKLFSKKNEIKTRLKNGKSFEKWCFENDKQDVINRWDYELNNTNPNEILHSSKVKYYFKCPKGIHKSELKSIKDFTGGNEGSLNCKSCNSFAQWGIDNICPDFLEKYWDYEKNEVNPWETSRCCDKLIWIKCQEKDYHGSYDTKCSEFFNGNRCSYCSNSRVHKLDSLALIYPKVLKLWSDKNKKSPYEYSPSSGKSVWWKCPEGKHEDYYRLISGSSVKDFRCPECVKEREESLLQEKVRLYLTGFGYKVLHEYACTISPNNPKTNKKLPYDNEIKELKLIIEIHGSQHYKETSGKWFNEKFDFKKRQLYDRYKRIYAKSRGYHYLEIPYWTDNSQEEWKQLIDDKINEILNKVA